MPEEMTKLRELLDQQDIEWRDDSFDRKGGFPFLDLSIYRTKFRYNGCAYSVICGYGTYGGEVGLLELRIGDCDPVGNMTAEEVMEIIED